MSKRDYKKDFRNLSYFTGRKIRIITATNSLKLQRSNNRGRNRPYIWIDPSWSLEINGKEISSSWSHPWHECGAYKIKFKTWCKSFNLVQGQTLQKIQLLGNGTTKFKFSNGFVLFSYPSSSSLDEGQDYDDWYAEST